MFFIQSVSAQAATSFAAQAEQVQICKAQLSNAQAIVLDAVQEAIDAAILLSEMVAEYKPCARTVAVTTAKYAWVALKFAAYWFAFTCCFCYHAGQAAGHWYRNRNRQPIALLAPSPEEMPDTEKPCLDKYASLSSLELRKLCSEAGIKWRRVKDGRRHLSRQEMIDALSMA